MAIGTPERVSVPCSVCGGSASRHFAWARYAASDENFRVVRCSDCGFVYVSPRLPPTEVEEDYASRAPVIEQEGRAHVAAQAARHRFTLAEIEALFPEAAGAGLRVLEVGAGLGGFLDEGRARGHRVCGVDISRARVAFARDVLGLDVRVGDAFSTELPEATWDVVFCAHTLEHLFDPRSALERIRALLRPGGLACVIVPNLDFVGGRRRRGRMIDDPRHLSHFTSETLERLLRATGLAPERVSAGLALFGAWSRLLPDEAWVRRAAALSARVSAPLGSGGEIVAFAWRAA